MKPSSRRQALLDTATELFNKYGFHPTGIDLIIKESGASKATLYKYFKNKETLILEVLKTRQQEVTSEIKTRIEENDTNEHPILTIFDTYNDWFKQTTYSGCFFQKACSEFEDIKSPINQFCVKSKNEFLDLITDLISQKNQDLVTAQKKARGIMMLLDGAIIDAQMLKNTDSVLQARYVAAQILKN